MAEAFITPDEKIRMWALNKAIELVKADKAKAGGIGKSAQNMYDWVTKEKRKS